MDALLEALGPAFVASVALQQLLELLDPILEVLIREHKKWILSVITLLVALGLSFGMGLRILEPLGFSSPAWFDSLLTALFLTSGTKAFNDLVKLIGYQKAAARARLTPEQAAQV